MYLYIKMMHDYLQGINYHGKKFLLNVFLLNVVKKGFIYE